MKILILPNPSWPESDQDTVRQTLAELPQGTVLLLPARQTGTGPVAQIAKELGFPLVRVPAHTIPEDANAILRFTSTPHPEPIISAKPIPIYNIHPKRSRDETGQQYSCGPGLHEWNQASGLRQCRICHHTYWENRRQTQPITDGSATHTTRLEQPHLDDTGRALDGGLWAPDYPEGRFPPFYQDPETDDLFV